MDDPEIIPHFLDYFPAGGVLIIDDQGFPRPRNGSIKEFKIRTKFRIVINILHYLLNITDNFLYLNCPITHLYNTLSINQLFLILWDLTLNDILFIIIYIFYLFLFLLLKMFSQIPIILLLWNLLINYFEIFYKVPFLRTFAFSKEVEKNNVVEL